MAASRRKRIVCIVILTIPITILVGIWNLNYDYFRTGECGAFKRKLTDYEFLEAAMKDNVMSRWTDGQSLQSIMAENPDHCCFVVRDQSELYKEDKKDFGTYMVEVTIRFVKNKSISGSTTSRPYKSATVIADSCGLVTDRFLSGSADSNSRFYPQ